MAENKKRKGKSKLAFPLGLIVIIFAVVGVIFAVGKGVDAVIDLTDKSEKMLEYDTMLIPVVMYDPDTFDDVTAANLEQLTVCAVWGVMKDESIYPGKYETDDQGNIIIPAEDVDKKFAELFGTGVKPTHVGVKGYYDEFTFNEQSRCYQVTSAGSMPIYTPQVEKIEKNSNTILLTVGYIAGEAWAQDAYGNYIKPEPSKYVQVTLRENENGYYISALQTTDTPENAEPGVTVLAVAPVTTTALSEEKSTAQSTTEESSSSTESTTEQ